MPWSEGRGCWLVEVLGVFMVESIEFPKRDGFPLSAPGGVERVRRVRGQVRSKGVVVDASEGIPVDLSSGEDSVRVSLRRFESVPVVGEMVRVVDGEERLSAEVVEVGDRFAVVRVVRGSGVSGFQRVAGSWDDDDKGEGSSGGSRRKGFSHRQRPNFRLTERDLVILDFLARYRYGTKVQVARLVGTSEGAINGRMIKMGHADLLRKEHVSNGKGVWTPTREGLAVVDSDFSPLGAGKISLVTMAHTLGLANIGVEVETGNGFEALGVELDSRRVVTERVIRGSMDRMKKARELRESDDWVGGFDPDDIILRDEEFDPLGNCPEIVPGNEGLYVLRGGDLNGKDHIPDMVIPIPRDAQGFPRALAVELELSPKPQREWQRILLSYVEDQTFGKVVYFTHKKSILNGLMSVARGVGLTPDKFEVRKYTPTTEHLVWG